MATAPSAADPDTREAGSQFLITLGDNLDYLDGKAAPFGRVVEGFDTLENINTAFIDQNGRPLKDIRIRHTIVLDEGEIPDPPGFVEPTASPIPTPAQLATVRIADDENLEPTMDEAAIEKLRREREARAQALTLEMVGDLPFAEVAPPENVLFVCKLNPVTRDEDLELIFSRFGTIFSCEVIRDKRTGDSLQYAFVEFAEKSMCEMAYHKMQNVLIDDHRIHVDFSQSVSRLADVWRGGENGKQKWRAGGGFGGVEELEKKSQYRNEADRPTRGVAGGSDRAGQAPVFDDKRDGRNNGRRREHRDREPDRKPSHRRRSRSRSPRRRSKSPRRYHDDYHDRRRRDRSRSPVRREHSRDRYRDDGRYRR